MHKIIPYGPSFESQLSAEAKICAVHSVVMTKEAYIVTFPATSFTSPSTLFFQHLFLLFISLLSLQLPENALLIIINDTFLAKSKVFSHN